MDYKKISTFLKKENDKDYLVFKFDSKELSINLNSDNQDSLEDLFYFIIDELFKEPLQFDKPNIENYSEALYLDVCNDYIEKLNNEILSVLEKIPEELKKQ